MEQLTGYEAKAHKMVASYCLAAKQKAQGKRKKHVPYSVPKIAEALCKALGMPEPTREREIKRLFEIELTGSWSLI